MAKKLALLFGAVLVILGGISFVPNPIIGPGAFFATNLAHDILHIVLGVLLIGAAIRMTSQSAVWLKIIGIAVLLVALLGFLIAPNGGMLLGLFAVNFADHLLHAVLGVTILVAGFVSSGGVHTASSRSV